MKNNPIIVLVGTGSLGIRYLQGMLACNLNLKIIAYDVSLISLEKAKNFCKNISNKQIQLEFTNNLSHLPKRIDLLILSNTADTRPELIYKFSDENHYIVSYWLIEKLISQSLDDLNKMKKIFENKNNVWVNHPRRVMKWYKEISSVIPLNQKLKFEVSGHNWGLACNAVHFFDLFDWWLNKKLSYLKFEDLGNKWFNSKRKGFIEINGKFSGKYSCGSEVMILSDNKKRDFKINIFSENEKWILDYKNGQLQFSGSKYIFGRDMLMSELIPHIVNDIILNNSCGLTNFNDSADYYEKVLKCLLDHWNTVNKSNSKSISIT